MYNITKEDIHELRNKIFEKFASDYVEENDDIVSLYTVMETLNKNIVSYNAIFSDNKKYLKQKINYLRDSKKKELGITADIYSISISVNTDGEGKIDFISRNAEKITLYKGDINHPIYKKYYKRIKIIFDTLEIFAKKNPGFAYTWSSHSKLIDRYEISDGFIGCTIDFEKTHDYIPDFVQAKDQSVGSCKYNNILLYEYIDIYKEEIAKKTPIESSTLDPYTRGWIEKTRQKDSDIAYTRTKK